MAGHLVSSRLTSASLEVLLLVSVLRLQCVTGAAVRYDVQHEGSTSSVSSMGEGYQYKGINYGYGCQYRGITYREGCQYKGITYSEGCQYKGITYG